MKGTANWHELIASIDMISKLTTAPVPCEYVAKSGGHAILYVTVRALKICNHEIIIESIPVNRVILVSFTCSCDFVVVLRDTSATRKNTKATPHKPTIPTHKGDPPSHSIHLLLYRTCVDAQATQSGPEYPGSHWLSVIQSNCLGTLSQIVPLMVMGQHRSLACSLSFTSENASPQSIISSVSLFGNQKPDFA